MVWKMVNVLQHWQIQSVERNNDNQCIMNNKVLQAVTEEKDLKSYY